MNISLWLQMLEEERREEKKGTHVDSNMASCVEFCGTDISNLIIEVMRAKQIGQHMSKENAEEAEVVKRRRLKIKLLVDWLYLSIFAATREVTRKLMAYSVEVMGLFDFCPSFMYISQKHIYEWYGRL